MFDEKMEELVDLFGDTADHADMDYLHTSGARCTAIATMKLTAQLVRAQQVYATGLMVAMSAVTLSSFWGLKPKK